MEHVAQHARLIGELSLAWRQYLYFCSRKASKANSTCAVERVAQHARHRRVAGGVVALVKNTERDVRDSEVRVVDETRAEDLRCAQQHPIIPLAVLPPPEVLPAAASVSVLLYQ